MAILSFAFPMMVWMLRVLDLEKRVKKLEDEKEGS